MKVRMKVEVSGNRDGQSWPSRGGTIDLPKSEAMQLCSNGMAVPVDSSDDDVETAVQPAAEEKRGTLTTESASAVTPGASPEKAEAPAVKHDAAPEKPAARRGPGRPRKSTEAAPTEKK
ncbi:hypothetical protein [Streptomyces sp. NPDC020983]|uniref:hypothetical protein n=1 Tax=Streptomyces sp. NPDC020983 TaxID=3365106 RepID=UPI00378BA5D3